MTGAEHLPALRPADGGLGEEGGADGEQPAAESQGDADARVLREAVPRDPQAAGAAGALPEVKLPASPPPCLERHRPGLSMEVTGLVIHGYLDVTVLYQVRFFVQKRRSWTKRNGVVAFECMTSIQNNFSFGSSCLK